MPVPSPEPSQSESKFQHLGRTPHDGMSLDILRCCLYGWRAVAAMMGHKVRVAIGDFGCEIKNSTSDADLALFLHEIVGRAATAPAQREMVQRIEGAGIMVPPFQLNALRNSVVSSNGYQIPLPHRLANVFKAMLEPDPLNPECRRSYLSYEEVAGLYKAGWIEDFHPGWPQTTKDDFLRREAKNIMENPHPLAARQWARETVDWFEKNGITPGQIYSCDKVTKCYKLETGWHPTDPLLCVSEAGLVFSDDPEKFRNLQGKKRRTSHQYERD